MKTPFKIPLYALTKFRASSSKYNSLIQALVLVIAKSKMKFWVLMAGEIKNVIIVRFNSLSKVFPQHFLSGYTYH